ncbi:MAG: DUF3784 domain-containing protein [Eubacteriales bacterium]|nr:DUF3784 domain-containing protein [Eubacteriales bacterium]
MGRTVDLFLTAAAIIMGIMLMTGHGDIFMKGGNAAARKKTYDENKMARASGVALILVGIATGIDTFTTTAAAKLVYVGVLLVVFGGLIYYMRKKCRK